MKAPTELLQMANRFRENALATQLPLYAACMLRAAADLEQMAKNPPPEHTPSGSKAPPREKS